MFNRNNPVRASLIDIFNDTEQWYQTDDALKNAVNHSIDGTKIYLDGAEIPAPVKRFDHTDIEVNRQRSFEAARNIHIRKNSARIGVLNFASASTPGGGVKSGAGAQEECLCRCSTLYPTLTTDAVRKNFYTPHRRQRNPIHNDDCIYTPEILVIKSDTAEPERLDKSDWLTIDVLTCAAPKLRNIKIDDTELETIHVKRGRHILNVAANHNIDVMILGAFGCGAFMNDPNVVAGAYKKILPEFDGIFDEIIFAVYCRPPRDGNFVAFDRIING